MRKVASSLATLGRFPPSAYGSDGRASQPKVSQLDRTAVSDLLKAFRQAFPGLWHCASGEVSCIGQPRWRAGGCR